jgi:superfamily II DNA or RNA helicase
MKKKISPKNRDYYENILPQIENLKKNDLINSYLGNKGYSIYKVSLNEKIISFIKKELTVKPFTQGSIIESESFPVYMESDKKIYVPRFWGINIFGYPKSVKISLGKSIDLKFNGELRDYQKTVMDSYLKAIKLGSKEEENSEGGALIELYAGAGKTIISLKIIEQIKKKTIIFVHKTFLKNQWIERIKQYLPDARIGTIQGQVIDVEDKDIVIAMIQSISMKSYPDSLFDDFGLSMIDEVHHISSQTFSNCLRKCTTLYSLGLSATMNRKDGLTHVFKMYLGDICNKQKKKAEEDNVLVKAIDYVVLDDDEYNEVARDFRGNVKHSTMLSKVSKLEYRSNFILNVIENELKINKEQQIILLGHQKNLLNYIFKAIELKNMTSVGYYIGGMKEKDLKVSESKQIILATYAMAAEGLDIPSLTTLILATPKSDIVQSVGRILRAKHNEPLIIDIIDQHDCFLNQFNKRKAFYNEKNYKIIRTNNERYIDYIKYIKKGEEFDEEEIWKEVVVKSKKSKENKCLIKI